MRCPRCGRSRLVAHPELDRLAVAHVDCDAFYCSVEKRDRPELADRPVIVGGGSRGVVSSACYIARMRGVRSAMPMFTALAACPDAVVIRPDFASYARVARSLRAMMEALTPLVQPLSIDEAVLDLSGTEALHRAPPAVMLARLAARVEAEERITVSIGLSSNRLLAKLAAGIDKPRGFAVLGSEAPHWLAARGVRTLPGIGPAQERALVARGFTTLGQLQALGPREAQSRLGPDGPALVLRARGIDTRRIDPARETKSVSAETTFDRDLRTLPALEAELWRLCERLGARLRDKDLAAGGVVLKLKTAAFRSRTRTQRLHAPTRLPDTLFATARKLLAREIDGTEFRLIGIGAAPIRPGAEADRADLSDPALPRRVATQQAIDALRLRFGAAAVGRGRGLGDTGTGGARTGDVKTEPR
ncbi:DNA polymerase-4 [Endobacter medicaginis]|uniref:DNA polymerase IV n=1 Tax=Endobacter medicaginis TaxID=1181271 RepID=A0A839V2R2_9PROT|nr:DNA polymerase-4 [Endobacter medicaginis]MCX5475545.1 DNA polymerase IV [Endobacter medicaginis]